MMWERDLRHFDIYKVDYDDVSMKLEVVKYTEWGCLSVAIFCFDFL